MARYLILIRFTPKGAKDMRKSASRAKEFAKAAAKAGLKVEAQYWCVGRYDGAVILSGKSDEAVLKQIAKLAAAGNVTTESVPLLDASQFKQIVS